MINQTMLRLHLNALSKLIRSAQHQSLISSSLMLRLGDNQGALRKCNDFIKLQPDCVDVQLMKGKILIAHEKFF